MTRNINKGITALEIIVVIAVIGILITVSLPKFYLIREGQVSKNAVGEILSVLSKARSQTLASMSSSEYGVHFQSDKITLFKGTVYTNGASSNEITNIVTPAVISNISLTGAGGPSEDVYFSRLLASPSKTGTITVSTPSFTKIVTISATGAASSN